MNDLYFVFSLTIISQNKMLGVISNHYIAIYVSKNVYISADTSIQVFFTPKYHLRYVQKYLTLI